jgi:hypothetical protein
MAIGKSTPYSDFPMRKWEFSSQLRSHSHVSGSLTAPFCFVDEASQLTEPAILHAFRKAVEAGNVSG